MQHPDIAGTSFKKISIPDDPAIQQEPSCQASKLSALDSAAVPGYLRDTYYWAYLDPRNVKRLDHEWIVRTILWQQHRRLEAAAFAEIEPGQRVMQAACVYGSFSASLAAHIGPAGALEVFDVAEVQVLNCRRKLAGFEQAAVWQENVLNLRNGSFDVVVCYFLMHEIPDELKYELVDALSSNVGTGGKIIFVDYHKPHWAHPLKPVTSLVFDKLEPYAKGLWEQDIAEFAQPDNGLHWHKETYFGRLYQKVVATRHA